MFDFKNVAPAMSMLDVIRAATRTCDSTANCRLNCAYYHFCESLKRSYYEVQRACDDNPELRSFIEQAAAEIQFDRYTKARKNSVYGEMKKEDDNNGKVN
jgi:hypothetical protein